MRRIDVFFLLLLAFILFQCGDGNLPARQGNGPITEERAPRIVFVTGDEEYRSEESMPMLARIVERELAAVPQVVYALDIGGNIDPDEQFNIPGLEALDSADLAVFFLRYRQLPPEQAKHILDYVERGKPIVGFRTSTHAFKYLEDSTMMHLNDDWPTRVFGQQWITHHGHFEDGHAPLTRVETVGEGPLLNGVDSFLAYSWLYHVDGGEWSLEGEELDVLLEGISLRSKHEEAGRLDQYPLTNPVAWTKRYTGEAGVPARVFFTTLGHPYDFKREEMRTLALNGIYWALGREDEIPAGGVNSEPVEAYEPTNSGFGGYVVGRKPGQ